MSEDEDQAIIIAHGSGSMKSGFAGDDAPRSVIPTVVSRYKNDRYFGDEAVAKRGIAALRYPIEHGIITNWDDIEAIWQWIFRQELRVLPEEGNLLTSTSMGSGTKAPREKMCQIAFETFRVKKYYTHYDQVLACYASGRTTALMADSGYGIGYVVPVWEGYALPHAVTRMDFGGQDLTLFQRKLLAQKYEFFGEQAKHARLMELEEDMKRKAVYVAPAGFEQELKRPFISNVDALMPGYLRGIEDSLGDRNKYSVSHNKEIRKIFDSYLGDHFEKNWRVGKRFILPDENEICLGEERFKIGEVLFNPGLIGVEQEGFHKMIHNAFMKCDCDIRMDLYSNIVLCGGNTMLPGIKERLEHELKQLFPSACRFKIISMPQRQHSNFVGGSILASLSTFQEMWVTKSEYEEAGPSIVNRKCT